MTPEPIEPTREESREEIRELRRLWDLESADPPELPAESLDEADTRTRAAVHWLQAACAEEAERTAAADLPDWVWRRQLASRPTWRSRPAQLSYAIGALTAAAAALVLIQPAPIETPRESTATLVGELDAPAVTPSVADPSSEPPLVAYRGDRSLAAKDQVVLVTGSVRVLLLQPQHEVTVEITR